MNKFLCVIFFMLLIASSYLFCGELASSIIGGESIISSGISNSVPASALSSFFPQHTISIERANGITYEEVVIPNASGEVSRIIDLLGINIISKGYSKDVYTIYGYSKLLSIGNNVEIVVGRSNIYVRVER